MFANQEVN